MGFHFRFRWPKCTPASSNCSKLTLDIFDLFCLLSLPRPGFANPTFPHQDGILRQSPGSLARIRAIWILNGTCDPRTAPSESAKTPRKARFPGIRSVDMLTFAELETFTSLGTTRLLPFNHTRVTGQKTFGLQRCTVFGIDGTQSPGDTKTQSFRLAANPATIQIGFHVELIERTRNLKSLVGHVLQNRCGEISLVILAVHHDIPASCRKIHTGNGGLPSTCFICYFHDYLRSLTLIGSGFWDW